MNAESKHEITQNRSKDAHASVRLEVCFVKLPFSVRKYQAAKKVCLPSWWTLSADESQTGLAAALRVITFTSIN